jgi:hypothetical protein
MRFWLCVSLLLIAPSLRAEDSIPLVYTRANITLVQKSVSPLPWQSDQTPAGSEVTFDTEIRDGDTFYNQEGWFNLAGPAAGSAVMLVFGAPLLAPITKSPNYAPLDVVLLNEQGTVMQIFPKLRLSSLQEEIYPAQPISAFLFLQAGTCEALSISPGDYVSYKLFKRPPKTLVPAS